MVVGLGYASDVPARLVLHFLPSLLGTAAQEALGPIDWGFVGGWVLGPAVVSGILASVRRNGIRVGVSGQGGAIYS